ncbi:hypothetical protein CAL7716_082800 [Calothrix sp. PCC 7716]|nr:hypothetical protein CAL7716_082800 [Calothrix sp. PCC 7716]
MALFILLCNEEKQPDIKEFISEAREQIIDDIELPVWSWSCGNTKGIQVGDKIFIQRTGKKPNGFFAYGVAVAADENYQLRLTEDKYNDFSEAYITESYGSSYVILVEIHSVVDYDHPLERDKLKAIPNFRDVSLHFQRGGCEIKPDYLATLLYSEWEKHSMVLARKGFGARIIDVICEVARELADEEKYKEAIETFEGALSFNSEYVKAKNGIKKCLSMLTKQSQASTANNEEAPTNDTENVNDTESNDIATNEEDLESAFYGRAENNRKVEVAAIDFVTKLYETEGWSVESVEQDKVGYDLICRKGNERQDVEVKGRSGNHLQFVITANEVKQALENPAFILYLVTSAVTNPKPIRCTGNKLLQQFSLEPIAYRAQLKEL